VSAQGYLFIALSSTKYLYIQIQINHYVVTAIEVTAIIHGLLGTIFLMAFAGAFAELIELTHSGVSRLKIGTALMAG